jgi:hypothetical protein
MVIQIVQHTMFNWLHATIERDGEGLGLTPFYRLFFTGISACGPL